MSAQCAPRSSSAMTVCSREPKTDLNGEIASTEQPNSDVAQTATTRGRKLVVFIHIPKTGGTSSAEALSETGPGERHAEHVINSADFAEHVRSLAWVAGHVTRRQYDRLLPPPKELGRSYFSCVRDPVKQVASHYNWLIEIRHRGRAFFNGHPEKIRFISDEISQANNEDPATIIRMLQQYSSLFLNLQSKYLLRRVDFAGIRNIKNQLSRYNFIGNEATRSSLYRRMGI